MRRALLVAALAAASLMVTAGSASAALTLGLVSCAGGQCAPVGQGIRVQQVPQSPTASLITLPVETACSVLEPVGQCATSSRYRFDSLTLLPGSPVQIVQTIASPPSRCGVEQDVITVRVGDGGGGVEADTDVC